MSSKSCPVCSDQFGAAGGVRDHAWDQHRACYYCGELLGDDADKSELYKHWLTVHPDDLRRVDRKQAEAEVDSLSTSERLSHDGVGAAVVNLPRRYFLIGGGAAAAVGIAGAGAYLTSRSDSGQSNGGTGDVEYEYPLIGSTDAATTITYFGSYKCPFCAQFTTTELQDLIREYVEPGDIAIRYRTLSYFNGRPFLGPDAPNAGHADLAVYNNEPESYLAYHEYVHENQPPESQQWATPDRLTQFAREAGVSNTEIIRTAIEEQRYETALRDSASAAAEAGVRGTPSLLIDGTVATPGQDPVRDLIEDAIASS